MLYLIDAAAVLNDAGFFFREGERYATTAEVDREFRDFRSRHLVDGAIQEGLLRILAPTQRSLIHVRSLAQQKRLALSEADLSVAAVALDLKNGGTPFQVLTDDYSLQNLLLGLQLPFKGVLRGEIRGEKSFKPQKRAKTTNK